jgi:hypothetical protein
MRILGYILITAGFLAGSLAAVVDIQQVQWHYFVIAVAIGAAGIAFVRLAKRHIITSEGKLTSNMQSIEIALAHIVENITQLNARKQSINTYDVRHHIDQLFIEDINTFVQARQTIAHVYGLAAYGDVMNHFAAGERYLNRVWSASADGYIDEVNDYLEKAQAQFSESLDKIRNFKSTVVSPR